ncbi:hypothetical protein LTR86_004447 [Recurvomyces mirabilis]|nr:hypothetical protein LTR86_004447 [Recurvomyces mirabilis]
MLFSSISALLLAATVSTVIGKPVPITLGEIERRWSQGHSEHEIHPSHDIREATPAWTVVRDPDMAIMTTDSFGFTTDERTMLVRGYQPRNARLRRRVDNDAGLVPKMKQFVEDFMRSKGLTTMIARSTEDTVDEAPVLKPKRGMRYRFTA